MMFIFDEIFSFEAVSVTENAKFFFSPWSEVNILKGEPGTQNFYLSQKWKILGLVAMFIYPVAALVLLLQGVPLAAWGHGSCRKGGSHRGSALPSPLPHCRSRFPGWSLSRSGRGEAVLACAQERCVSWRSGTTTAGSCCAKAVGCDIEQLAWPKWTASSWALNISAKTFCHLSKLAD